MKQIARAIAAVLALLPAVAAAQVPSFPQTVPAQTVVGRLGITSGPTSAIPIATLAAIFGKPQSITTNARCDGATDDTAAINADLALGGYWTLPAGKTCNVTQINITLSGTRLSGAGFNSSIIQGTTAAAPTINVSASLSNVYLDGFQVTKSVTATSGGTGIKYNGDCQYCVVDGVYAQKSYVGIAAQSTGVGYMRHVLAQLNIADGISFTNSSISGTVQWDLDDVFSGQNGGRGFVVTTGSAGPTGITLGSWHNVRTFANTGVGAGFVGTAIIPINGVRITKAFFGQDGNHEVYLDTYGGLHTISGYFELAGTSATGPTLATAASATGDGIRITANNIDVAVDNSYINGNHDSGINTSASSNTAVTGTRLSNHGLYGILAANCAKLNGASLVFLTNTTSNVGCTLNTSSLILVGSTPASINAVTTQSANDNSTKPASTAYVDRVAKKVISSNTTFNVTTTGNNANGCTNNTTDACLTMQRAYDNLVDNYRIQGKDTVVTIQMGNGTYTSGLLTSRCVDGQNGTAGILILGNAAPSSVIISPTSNDAFGLGELAFGAGTTGCTQISIGGMRLQTTTSGNAVNVSGGGVGITVGTSGFPIDFGNTVQDHMVANHGAWIIAGTNNTISGGALIHVAALSNSQVALHNTTETCTGSPAFTYFAFAESNASLFVDGMTFTSCNTATGTRFFAAKQATIIALTDTLTYLPGNATGVDGLDGGRYVKLTAFNVWAGQLSGTATNDNASAGNVGEYIESVIASGSAVSLVTATAKDVTSISLTAGDWDVEFVAGFTGGATTTVNYLIASISTTANTLDQTNGRFVAMPWAASTVFNSVPSALFEYPGITVRMSLSATTTVRCVGQASFGTSTLSGYGLCRARRVR